ncbi:MAG: 50S ribosomal protein L9 [Actinomycetota bacterium]
MKVVLQKSVAKLGVPGDVVEVADGYARNYLMPRGLAVRATDGMVKHQTSLKRAHAAREEHQRSEAQTVASRLQSTPLVLRAKAGEEGKLFGSVTAADIAGAIARQAGLAVDRHAVRLAEPIRTLGEHRVTVHLFAGVDADVAIRVEAQ